VPEGRNEARLAMVDRHVVTNGRTRVPSSADALTAVVVEIDDRVPSQRAVIAATRLAIRLGLKLHIATVHPRNGTGAEYSWRRLLVDDERCSVLARHPELDGRIDTRVLVADTAGCALCEAYPAAVAVTAARCAVYRSRAARRTAARELANRARHHPVVVVGPSVVDDRAQRGTLTVASGGTFITAHVLRASMSWATAFGTGIDFIEVAATAGEWFESAEHNPYLHALCRRVEYAGTSASHRTLIDDDSVRAVVRFLRERESPLAVLASHRLDDELRTIESTTLRLIEESPCPTLLLPARHPRGT
jgi:hypothetical protein